MPVAFPGAGDFAQSRQSQSVSGTGRVCGQSPGDQGMVTRERVEAVLERVRPFLQADGGDIELLEVQGNSAKVRLTGMCAGCPSAHMTLYMGVEMALREEIREFEELHVV